jgi:hypothetical protein
LLCKTKYFEEIRIMDEKTAIDELQFIKKVIEDSRKSITYNGMDYIFWGIIVIVGMLIQYFALLRHNYFNFFWIWAVLIPIGWVFSFYNARSKKEKLPRTFSGRIISAVWGATGIGMTLLGFIGTMSGGINGEFVSPILSVVLGTGYYITGKIVEAKWVSNIAFCWWIGGIVMFYYHGVHSILIMALMMLFFQTVPGVIIYRKYKKEQEAKS